MKLISFGHNGIGRMTGENSFVDIGAVVAESASGSSDPMRALIENWDSLADAAASAVGPERDVADIVLDAPIRRPGMVVAAPINYRDHQIEMQQIGDIAHLGVFLKAPASVLRPGGEVRLPYHDRRFDQEGELAVVIGRTATKVPAEEALRYVFGYTGLLDITMRGGEDRSTRKSFETFTPMGPWIVTADEIPDPGVLDLRCSVSGHLRQKANTRDLIWGVAELVAYTSSVVTLRPGDVITTGTPAGVGPIEDGSQIVLELESIGTLTATVSAAGAVASPTLGANSGPVAPPAPESR
jgi:2-keto-4-pentenoate hydratase/2-oxohepta-3-ene-1,7-dioic acid hydratase in catechol pathway